MIRAWLKLMWNSAVVAAVAAAAQLGVADVLNIIRWDSDGGPLSAADWSTLLTWIAFSFTVAVLTGALAGRRALAPDRRESVGVSSAALAMSVLGAGAAVALAWLPARDVTPPVRVQADLVVAITAGAGILIGLVVSLMALSISVVAAGLRAAITWVWLLAIGSAAAGILSHQPYAPPRLAVVDAPSVIPVAWWNGPRLMIAVAAVLALIVALVARMRGAGRFGVALSGFFGPAIIAGAYLLAGPGVGTDRDGQYDPYLASLIAAGAGLLVSVIVAMPGRRGPRLDREELDLGLLTGDVVTDTGRPTYAHLDSTTSGHGFPSVPHQATDSNWPPRDEQPPWHTASTQPDLPAVTPRHANPQDYAGTTFSASLYPGGTHASPMSEPPAMMGQPPADDLHETWLRDLGSTGSTGSSGRHSR